MKTEGVKVDKQSEENTEENGLDRQKAQHISKRSRKGEFQSNSHSTSSDGLLTLHVTTLPIKPCLSLGKHAFSPIFVKHEQEKIVL